MPRLEGGPHGLKADPSARVDDQDYRHGVMLPVGPAWLTVMCDAGSRTARWAGGLKRVSRAVAVARRAPGRATRSGSATARQSSLACPFSKPHPRHAATARVPSAHASSAHGREKNACGMPPEPGKTIARKTPSLGRELSQIHPCHSSKERT